MRTDLKWRLRKEPRVTKIEYLFIIHSFIRLNQATRPIREILNMDIKAVHEIDRQTDTISKWSKILDGHHPMVVGLQRANPNYCRDQAPGAPIDRPLWEWYSLGRSAVVRSCLFRVLY